MSSSVEVISVEDTLKLALEALKNSETLINGTDDSFGLAGAMDGYYSDCFDLEKNEKLMNQAITSLRQAIAVAERSAEQHKQAQPSRSDIKQEPVAWVLEWTFDGEEKGRRLYDDETHCVFDAESDGGVCRPLVYGDTSPPQRQPLTGEALVKAAQSCLSPHQYDHFEALLENDPDAHNRLSRAIENERGK